MRGLIQIDRDERFFEDGTYIAYSSYIGRTKYGDFDFAVEIMATGQYGQGLLTISVYSNEEAILSGFFYEVLEEVKKSIEITKEKVHVAEKVCPECGAKLDLGRVDDEGYLSCEFCGTHLRLSAWARNRESI